MKGHTWATQVTRSAHRAHADAPKSTSAPFAFASNVTTSSKREPSGVSACAVSLHRKERAKRGMSTDVTPLYVQSSGRDAMVGNMSLYRHGKSNTSSAKPSSTMKQIDSSAAL